MSVVTVDLRALSVSTAEVLMNEITLAAISNTVIGDLEALARAYATVTGAMPKSPSGRAAHTF